MNSRERQTNRPVTSKEVKMPKIVKSPPASQEQKLGILHSPKKNNPTAIKSHEDSPSVKSNLSPKSHFGDLQRFHQELKISLMQWDYTRNLSH
jgi:hypothetical protein